MPHATSRRRLSWNEPVTPASPGVARTAHLPPTGCSPALDLQRRLGEAALRGFYAPEPRGADVSVKRVAMMVATALASWTIVFGTGALLLG